MVFRAVVIELSVMCCTVRRGGVEFHTHYTINVPILGFLNKFLNPISPHSDETRFHSIFSCDSSLTLFQAGGCAERHPF